MLCKCILIPKDIQECCPTFVRQLCREQQVLEQCAWSSPDTTLVQARDLFVSVVTEGHRTIMWCTLNYPGSWHDADLAKQLDRLLDELPEGFAIAAHSVFTHKEMAGKILLPLKSDKLDCLSHGVSVKQFVAAVKHHRLAL